MTLPNESDAAEQLRIAREALKRIDDPRETSLRWRSRTSGGAIEKPNVRAVAAEALDAIERLDP